MYEVYDVKLLCIREILTIFCHISLHKLVHLLVGIVPLFCECTYAQEMCAINTSHTYMSQKAPSFFLILYKSILLIIRLLFFFVKKVPGRTQKSQMRSERDKLIPCLLLGSIGHVQ